MSSVSRTVDARARPTKAQRCPRNGVSSFATSGTLMVQILRHFSFASAHATVPVTVVLVVVYRDNGANELVDLAENQNAAPAQSPRP